MARRKRKKKSASSNPMPMIAGAAAAIALLVAGYWILTSGKGNADFPTLPANDLHNNPSSLRGSDFSVTGKVKSKLHHSDSKGSTIDVEVVQDGEVYRFPFRVPNGVDGPNLSTEQSYTFNGTVTSKERFVVSSYSDK